VDELVGAAEIARRLGVKRPGVVHDWRRRYPEFPQPVTTLQAGHVWAWPDVEKWAKKTGRTVTRSGSRQ
jgi:transposase-like protein